MRFKAVVPVLLALLLAGAVGAQTHPVQFGIEGGANLAKLVYDPEVVKLDQLTGFGGGVTFGFPFSQAIGLDLGFLYMRKGAHYETSDEILGQTVTSKSDTELDYAIFCPTLRFRLPAGGLTPYLLGGGEVGFLLKARQKSTTTVNGESLKENTDIKKAYEDLDYGVNFGAGIEFGSGGRGLFVEARYALGLADIHKSGSSGEPSDDQVKLKTQGIYLLAGLHF